MNSRFVVALLTVVSLASCFRAPSDMVDGGGGAGTADGSVTTENDAGLDAGAQLALEILPAELTLAVGSSQSVRVFATDSNGVSSDVTAQASFTIEGAAARITGPTVEALTAGSATLRAQFGSATASAKINGVLVPASLEVNGPTVPLHMGEAFNATAIGILSDGKRVDLSETATWVISDPLTVSSQGSGRFTALKEGSVTLSASIGALTSSIAVSVGAAALNQLTVTPATASVGIGRTLALTATGTWSDGHSSELTNSAAWSSSNPSVEVRAGQARGISLGTATITAALAGRSATATLSVSAAPLMSISLQPGAFSLPAGTRSQLSVTATAADGSTSNVTESCVFSVDAPNLATISNQAGQRGLVSAMARGQVRISARLQGLAAEATLQITEATATGLSVDPATFELAAGATRRLQIIATFSDGTSTHVTAQSTFSSDNTSVATVTAAGPAAGLVTARSGGLAHINVQFRSLTALAKATVIAPQLTRVSVLPAQLKLTPGRTISLKATGEYSDGTQRDVTDQAMWLSSSATHVTVSNMAGTLGLARAVRVGSATITATFGGLSGSGLIEVETATITSVTIDPPVVRAPVGFPVYAVVTVVRSDGSTESVTESVSWSTSNPQVGAASTVQGYAAIEPRAPGQATLTATLPSGQTASLQLTVTAATLTQLHIDPPQPSMAPDSFLNMTATGIFSDFSTMDLTWYVTWSSSNQAVASITTDDFSHGLVSSIGAGTATITANYQGFSVSTPLTVTAATLREIQITPFAAQLPVGFETYLRATGIYSDNTTADLTYMLSWSSADPTIGSVSNYGRLLPLAAGTVTIRGVYGSVTGTNVITVTAATLQTITITATGAGPLAVQATRQLSALGQFSDGSTMDVTGYVTWLSNNATVASVSNAYPENGQAKGLRAGMATITAVRRTVTGVMQLNVQ